MMSLQIRGLEMKKLIFLAGAMAFVTASPTLAKPGKGNGNSHSHGHPMHGPGHKGERAMMGYGVGGCPPGLAKKAVPCVPPGQAKQMFNVGQRVPLGYKGMLGYNGLPYDLRDYYSGQLDPRSRYIYDNSYLYRVDPTTMVVQQVLNAILRPY